VYWNPAGLATGAFVSVLASFSEEIAPKIVALSLPPVGIAYYRLGTFGTERAASAVTGPPSREEVRRSVHALTTSTVGVSLLHSLSDYIVVGATPKVMWGDSTAFDVDAGVMIAVERIRLGLVARNLTTPSFETDLDSELELSREVRLGAGWGSGWPGHSRVVVSVDGDLTSRPTLLGDRRDVAAGVETWWLDRRLALRSGVRRSTTGDARAAVAAGASWALRPSISAEGHVTVGEHDERSWSVGLRMGF
jgi:hypothetical protein